MTTPSSGVNTEGGALTMKRRISLLFLCSGLTLLGQTGVGGIQGTVKDASGAVMPAAKVTDIHVPTAREYDTVTNQTGFYDCPSGQSGPYSIVIQSPGMETFRAEFLLRTGQTAVVDANMKVGAAATEVTVAASVTPL